MKNKIVVLLVSYLALAVFRTLGATLRCRYHGLEHLKEAEATGYIVCCWHQNLVSAALGPIRGPYVSMASRSMTADPIVKVVASLGHTIVRGSSGHSGRDKGGKTAMAEMTELLKQGRNGGMAADGPTGPANIAKPGIMRMAAETGHAVLPIAPMPSRYWEFNSWDKMRLPKPFATIDVYYGEPIWVPENPSEAESAAILEQISQQTTALVTQHETAQQA